MQSPKKINLHTILITVGPSNCGKTTFCRNYLLPLLHNQLVQQQISPNIQYISLDDIRRNLLSNKAFSKYDCQMLEASSNAFYVMKHLVRACIEFPVNAHFVIIDSTGLDLEFRQEIAQIANDYHYNFDMIVFNYKSITDYFKFCDGNKNYKNIIRRHVEKLRSEVLKELTKNIHNVNNRWTIKNLNEISDEMFKISKSKLAIYNTCVLNPDKNYLIIGDVHCSVDELKELIKLVGFDITNDIISKTDRTLNTEIILIGDIIDKGTKHIECIEFVHKNMNNLKLVCGNHEMAIFKLLLNVKKENDYGAEFIDKYYNSYRAIIESDPTLNIAEKFLEIVEHSRPFYVYKANVNDNTSRTFYVTHSPCHNKFIGKLDHKSIKNQIYYHLDRTKPLTESMSYILNNKQRSHNLPYHVFGHIAMDKMYVLKENNKIFLDSGCIHGNELTGIILGKNIYVPKIFRTKFMHLQPIFNEKLNTLNINNNKSRDIQNLFLELDDYEKDRINNILKNKVNYISGTIAPANKNEQTNELESLYEGINYYVNAYNNNLLKSYELCIEPKYMGSRMNVYLFRDNVRQSYAVSRNGFRIIRVPKEEMLKIYALLHYRLFNFMITHKIKMMIIDAELMPWRALGNELIDKSFMPLDVGIKTELDILENSGFEDYYNDLVNILKASGFVEDIKSSKMTASELVKKYGESNYQTFKNLYYENQSHITLSDMKTQAKVYHEQLEIYGVNEPAECKPFSILKIVHDDDSEEISNNNILEKEMFRLLSDDQICVIDLRKDINDNYQIAKKFYDNLTQNRKMEGIVIKPNIVNPDIAPMIKVRNENYLSIVYGPDYKSNTKYMRLIKQKNIKNKISMSIKEYNLGLEMLKVPYADINMTNTSYIETLVKFLYAERLERDIDPRL